MLPELVMGGLSSGFIYLIYAVGLVLIFQISRIPWFVQVCSVTFGSIFTYKLCVEFGLNFWLAMTITVCVCALMGIVFERIMRPLVVRGGRGLAEHLTLLTVIFAIYLALKLVAILWWGVYPKVIPSFAPFRVKVGGVGILADEIVVSLAGFLMIIGLLLFLKKTKLGKAIRAVSQDRETASVLGININRITCLVFVIAGGLAGVSGAFLGVTHRVDPYLVDYLNLMAFVIVLLGGLANVVGVFFTSLLIGVLEALLTGYVSSEFKSVFLFLFIVVFLIFRPMGILAVKERK